tara:strand:- start:333 stop:608 length:276 start_codon:yes stop_codon:yes gene_type:complete
MSEKKLTLKIFGQVLNLKSDADTEYAQKLADYVDKQIMKVSRQSNDPLKVVLLASMNIANDFFSEQKNLIDSNEAVSQKTDKLIELIKETV